MEKALTPEQASGTLGKLVIARSYERHAKWLGQLRLDGEADQLLAERARILDCLSAEDDVDDAAALISKWSNENQ